MPDEPSSEEHTSTTRADSAAVKAVSRSPNDDENATGELPVGEVINDKYRIVRVIGRGGMGVVHAALHLTLEETVAIKVLRPSMMNVQDMVMRFLREARAASKIKSEHVARVFDVDTLPSGVPYIVMEYLEGIDLAELRRKVGPLPITEAAVYIAQACDAIGEAHKLGIVHRDLKPSNLFLADRRDGDRMLKVLDFGISKMHDVADESTQTGLTMGSPRYMSPEQMQSLRSADGRADIWALGAILYELLTGRQPFLAQSLPQVCTLVLLGEPPPLRSLRPEVPLELEAIVTRCLRKAPEDRYSTADDLARALVPFCSPDALKPRSLRASGQTVIEFQVPPLPPLLPASLLTPVPAAGLSVDRTLTAMSSGGTGAWLRSRSWLDRSALVALGIAAALALGGVGLLLSHEEERATLATTKDGAPVGVAAGAPAIAGALQNIAAEAQREAPKAAEPEPPAAAPAVTGAPAASSSPTLTEPAASTRSGGKPPARGGQRPPPTMRDPFGGSRN